MAATTTAWPAASSLAAPSGYSDLYPEGISCWSPGDCAAVGSANSGSTATDVILTESNGTWGAAKTIPAPSGGSEPGLSAISCPAAGECTVAGSYANKAGTAQPMVAQQSGGTWGAATAVALPSNAASGAEQLLGLASISCASPGNCVAVGDYSTNQSTQYLSWSAAMAVAETNGKWAAQATQITDLPPDAGAGAQTYAYLSAVSCPAAGSCVATGGYQTTGSEDTGTETIEPWSISLTAGNWGNPVGLTPPSAPSSTSENYEVAPLYALSCTSVGNCTAVGDYKDTQDRQQAMVANETNGTWGATAELALPANADNSGLPDALVPGLSCPSAGNCLVAGSYFDTTSTQQPMVISEVNGVWGQASEVSQPSNAGSSSDGGFLSVSCPTSASCTAVGSYDNFSSSLEAMYDTGPISITNVSPPAAPTDVTASAGDGQVTVKWTEPAGGPVDGYIITQVGAVAVPTFASGSATQATVSVQNCAAASFQVRAVNAAGSSAPSAASNIAVPHWTPTGEPKVAVILMEGFDSPSYSDTYYATGGSAGSTPGMTSYCYWSDGGGTPWEPRTLGALMGPNEYNPPESDNGALTKRQPLDGMTDTLATHDGTVLLPWGWGGAWLTSDSHGALMHVNSAGNQAAQQVFIPVSTASLAREIASVHAVWPQTQIVVLAHSLGGLVAEQYWMNYWRSNHDGVSRVISLDGTINGIADAGPCETGVCDGMSGFVASFFSNLWGNITNDDPPVSHADGGGSLLLVGNPWDSVYNDYDSGSDGIISQLLFDCEGFLQSTCNLLSPAAIDPCQDSDHSSVKACPQVISFVDDAVFGNNAAFERAAARMRPGASIATIAASGGAAFPFARHVAGYPSAEPSTPAVPPGGTVQLTGSQLGTSGTLSFSTGPGRFTPATILSWNASTVTARVPAGAVTGPLRLTTSAGLSLPVGGVVVLGRSDGARSFHTRVVRHRGQLSLRVRVPGARRGSTVSVFDGGTVLSARVKRGTAMIALGGVRDASTRNFVLYSGQKWETITVRVPAAPKLRLRVKANRRRPRPGSKVEVTITVRLGAHRDAHVPLELAVFGSHGPLLAPEARRTGRTGKVSVKFREPADRNAVVVVGTTTSSTTLAVG